MVVLYGLGDNGVTTLLWRHAFFTDHNKIRTATAYVKIKLQAKHFFIIAIIFEKITIYYENHVYCALTLNHPPPYPHPFGPPQIGGVLVLLVSQYFGTHLPLPHTWGYFYNTQKMTIFNNIDIK